MELKEFIKETLIQIVEGVKEAQKDLKDSNCVINPAIHKDEKPVVSGMHKENTIPKDVEVHFEVILSQGELSGTKNGIGVMFATIGIGGQTKTDESNSSVTCVKFSVPLRYTKN